ncbi:hypothetical protein RSOLAG22IIIB_07505 [Rhizoctonia solani]|uniref:Uncharacterized protein n=1 Tax=Rhizoctonia solani TaxID=456999 RepID=A0A0K6FNB5_9AGAM|nr:hypothetical protein RSOLAG22IIIB_07505 [Rhizoctonia solani]
MRFTLSSLAILAVAVGHVAADSTQRRSLNPHLSNVRHADFENFLAVPAPETNAKRMAQGLPPMKPRSRKHRSGDVLKRGTHRRLCSPPSKLAICPSKSCNIPVKSAAKTHGYLCKPFDDIGEYGRFESSQTADALVVTFNYVAGSDAPVDLYATNGKSAAYPYMGAVSQYDGSDHNLAAGSSAFVNVGAIKQAPAGSPPVEGDTAFSEATRSLSKYESAIWLYDATTNQIRAQWINPNGSGPATYLVHATDADADLILFTGDPSALQRDHAGDYPEVTFTCLTPVSTPV